jgi:two-component system NtrC family sensor kinase
VRLTPPESPSPDAPRPLTVYEAGIAEVVNQLNNRLSAILGFTELARGAATSGVELDTLDHVASEARTAAAIVRDLIYLVRAPGTSRGAAHVGAVVDATLHRKRADLGAAGIEVATTIAPGLPLVACDAGDLEMLLLRLLSFALARLRGAPAPRRVAVTAVPIGASVLLTVGDSGPPLPSGHAEHELHYFRPADPTFTGHMELALAQRVAETCGAGVRLESTASGGAEVAVTLMPTSLLHPPEPAARTSTAPTGLRVLVADDDAANRRTLARLLERHGHEVVVAGDGAEAIEQLGTGPVDAVVMDVRMPRMDGREAFAHIAERWPALARRVVFVTGDDLASEWGTFVRRTGQPTLRKPFDIADLLAALAAVAPSP